VTGSPVLLACTADPKVVRTLNGLAAESGLAVHTATAGEPPAPPAVVVIDLDAPGALDLLGQFRERWPEALVAGHLGFPDRERWLGAERAGCDVVANRGSLGAALRKRLAAPAGTARGRRHPLLASADVAGRLGCVLRDDAAPVGPLALYHVGSGLYACADRCPHAGEPLSRGELEGPVVTCPRHGSQFDVRTGERLRGPADAGLATWVVLDDGGQVYALLPD
jgi:nitrite reductase/ring-hydroxylating ferredoxin subunit